MKLLDKLKPDPLKENFVQMARDAERYYPELKGMEKQLQGLHKLYGNPKNGCYRITFIGDDHVIKVPYNHYGIESNEVEAMWDNDKIPLAACELIDSPISSFGVQLLWMEKVTPVPGASMVKEWSEEFKYPDWVKSIDGYQVGFNAAGELVCFDP